MPSKKKQEDNTLQILRNLVALPPNKKCFDCGQRGPTYVNMTIGAFVCTSCSGLLRGINPPQRVKSISMASFSPTEIDFLLQHGNEVCRSTWLALWNSTASPEPDSRDEQKLKDFLMRKYERKMWYSSQPVETQSQVKEPEARPLKTLLGENAPQVVVVKTQKEQKSPNLSPTSVTTSVPKPSQPIATIQNDLLGDLGGNDPFASSSQSTNQASFGVFATPHNANTPMDFFAPSTQQAQQPDFFAASSQVNFPASQGHTPSDKYAVFASSELFKSSDTQSVFSSTPSIFSDSLNKDNHAAQPNPFMSPATSTSGVAVFQQQQQKPLNPFQNTASQVYMAPNSEMFSSSTTQQTEMNVQSQLNAFGSRNAPSNQSFGSNAFASSNQMFPTNTNPNQQFMVQGNMFNPQNGLPQSFNPANGGAFQANFPAAAATNQQAANQNMFQFQTHQQQQQQQPFQTHQSHMFSQQQHPFQQQTGQSQVFGQQQFPFPQQTGQSQLFGQQQPPFPHQTNQSQAFSHQQPPFQQQFSMQKFNAQFPGQQSAFSGATNKPHFGGSGAIGMQASQPSWNQAQGSMSKSTNPFM